MIKKSRGFIRYFVTLIAMLMATVAMAQGGKDTPNIVMIMIDDIAPMDISAIHQGLGAVATPGMDRLAKEGLIVSDYYGEASCTAGRAAFLTGQYPFRTGLTSVGQPGAAIGISPLDPTLATMLKARGYATALFGKSHVGDRNEHLPTVNGFDEFFGILYHLNVMEQFEQPNYPKDPNFKGRPRDVMHSWATDTDDPTVDPRFGKVGKQRIEYKGPLGSKRMATIDDEVLDATVDWLDRTKKTGKPFFLWFATTRMHQKIHVNDEWRGRSGHTAYTDALLQLDDMIAKLLKKLDDMGVSKNTIVMLTGDNGVNLAHWPDSGTASFHGEKGTTWDGGFRVPMLVRWPGHVPSGQWTGEFMTAEDWLPTLMAAAGDTDIKARLLQGTKIGNQEYKVHLDGYNQLPMLTGTGKSNRHEFFYYGDTDLNAIRVDQWKVHLATKDKWLYAPTKIDGGLLIDIKVDPFERSPDTGGHLLWEKEKSWLVPIIAPYIQAYNKSLKDYPPRQAGSGIGAATLFKN